MTVYRQSKEVLEIRLLEARRKAQESGLSNKEAAEPPKPKHEETGKDKYGFFIKLCEKRLDDLKLKRTDNISTRTKRS